MATRGRSATTAIGNTPGGRGRIPSNITTMSQYYRSGRSSALAPGATVRDQSGRRVSSTLRSGGSKS